MEQTVLDVLPPLSLPDAVGICNHLQYLVDGYYDQSNPGLGKIEALIIHTYDKRDEVIDEYKARKITHGKIYRAQRHRREEYDILLIARLQHPQLKTQFEIYKDLRTYAVEQSIDLPHLRPLQ
ncbi:hypothetical protein [Polluticoccus soli]|uniref:hypothetical protein n=1 Tax=Polluticoccus soli TaxID=3034150 RepID=UPI0023E1246F|nr:hypothetical protein [Flavipsychrobacter sp. JY13-12]